MERIVKTMLAIALMQLCKTPATLVAGGAFFVLLLLVSPSAESQEPPLQGQVPIEDQESGRSLEPYSLNVTLVGRNSVMNRGMNGNLGWVDDCAYVSAYFGGTHPLAGLAVVDASDPSDPQLVNIFPGTPGTRESQVEGNEESRMVVVMPFSAATIFGDPPGPTQFQIYDVSGDCRNPRRAGTYDFGNIITHEHKIWRDKIYAILTATGVGVPSLIVVDASDKDNPQLLTTWDLSDEPGMPESNAHDMDISADGTRAYVNLRTDSAGRGLVILDTSEVANWKPGMPTPTIRRISPIVNWAPDPGGSHSAQLVKIRGRKYVLGQNEVFTTAPTGCPWGWARIIDVNDEEQPFQISTFRLEVNQRRHCDRTTQDNAMYSTHYLGVDNPEEAKLAFFTWYSSGLRVVDISDPYAPKEVGYYIPGATTDTVFQDTNATRFGNRKIDYSYSFVRFHKGNVWFNSIYGGFWVVRFEQETAKPGRSARR